MKTRGKTTSETLVCNGEKRAEKISHPKECYVIEEVGGKMIYTLWDREEAFQLADQLLISGKETRNSLAVRRVACSLILPPTTESGKAAAPEDEKKVMGMMLGSSNMMMAEQDARMMIGSLIVPLVAAWLVAHLVFGGIWGTITAYGSKGLGLPPKLGR